MKRIFFVALCIVLVAGCGKRQQQIQKPQEPSTETQPVIVVNKETSKKEPTSGLYPVMVEKSKKIPSWVNEMISIYDTGYNSWREKSSSDTSSVLISSLTSSGVLSSSSVATSSIQSSSQVGAGISATERPSSILRSGDSSTSVASASRTTSTSFRPVVSPQTPDQSSSSPSDGTNPQPPREETPQQSGVNVTRTIQKTADGAYVRLNVNIIDSRVNGVIVTENLPDNYTFIDSTPVISKRTGNSIKWLFYGTSLTSQVINYQLKGSGRATISGSFSSTIGSGNISGDVHLGQ